MYIKCRICDEFCTISISAEYPAQNLFKLCRICDELCTISISAEFPRSYLVLQRNPHTQNLESSHQITSRQPSTLGKRGVRCTHQATVTQARLSCFGRPFEQASADAEQGCRQSPQLCKKRGAPLKPPYPAHPEPPLLPSARPPPASAPPTNCPAEVRSESALRGTAGCQQAFLGQVPGI
jgi:hypothetical protein